jgi:hypothetical protein
MEETRKIRRNQKKTRFFAVFSRKIKAYWLVLALYTVWGKFSLKNIERRFANDSESGASGYNSTALTHRQAHANKPRSFPSRRARTGSASSGRVLKIVPCRTIFCMVSEESREEIILGRGICRYMTGYKKKRR